jgi:hypothetical protein
LQKVIERAVGTEVNGKNPDHGTAARERGVSVRDRTPAMCIFRATPVFNLRGLHALHWTNRRVRKTLAARDGWIESERGGE